MARLEESAVSWESALEPDEVDVTDDTGTLVDDGSDNGLLDNELDSEPVKQNTCTSSMCFLLGWVLNNVFSLSI